MYMILRSILITRIKYAFSLNQIRMNQDTMNNQIH